MALANHFAECAGNLEASLSEAHYTHGLQILTNKLEEYARERNSSPIKNVEEEFQVVTSPVCFSRVCCQGIDPTIRYLNLQMDKAQLFDDILIKSLADASQVLQVTGEGNENLRMMAAQHVVEPLHTIWLENCAFIQYLQEASQQPQKLAEIQGLSAERMRCPEEMLRPLAQKRLDVSIEVMKSALKKMEDFSEDSERQKKIFTDIEKVKDDFLAAVGKAQIEADEILEKSSEEAAEFEKKTAEFRAQVKISEEKMEEEVQACRDKERDLKGKLNEKYVQLMNLLKDMIPLTEEVQANEKRKQSLIDRQKFLEVEQKEVEPSLQAQEEVLKSMELVAQGQSGAVRTLGTWVPQATAYIVKMVQAAIAEAKKQAPDASLLVKLLYRKCLDDQKLLNSRYMYLAIKQDENHADLVDEIEVVASGGLEADQDELAKLRAKLPRQTKQRDQVHDAYNENFTKGKQLDQIAEHFNVKYGNINDIGPTSLATFEVGTTKVEKEEKEENEEVEEVEKKGKYMTINEFYFTAQPRSDEPWYLEYMEELTPAERARLVNDARLCTGNPLAIQPDRLQPQVGFPSISDLGSTAPPSGIATPAVTD